MFHSESDDTGQEKQGQGKESKKRQKRVTQEVHHLQGGWLALEEELVKARVLVSRLQGQMRKALAHKRQLEMQFKNAMKAAPIGLKVAGKVFVVSKTKATVKPRVTPPLMQQSIKEVVMSNKILPLPLDWIGTEIGKLCISEGWIQGAQGTEGQLGAKISAALLSACQAQYGSAVGDAFLQQIDQVANQLANRVADMKREQKGGTVRLTAAKGKKPVALDLDLPPNSDNVPMQT